SIPQSSIGGIHRSGSGSHMPRAAARGGGVVGSFRWPRILLTTGGSEIKASTHCPFVDLFGAAGRRWLKSLPFAEEEQMILATTLQLHDALQDRMESLEAALQQRASHRIDVKLLMTIPGVNVTVAIGLVAAIGDIQRFPTPGQLSSYFGLVTRVHQSADKCYHGHITKAGRSHARWLAIEAAQSLARSASPLAATYHRIRRKKGHNVAVTALARKLIVLVWHMLIHTAPYRYAPVTRTRHKLRRVTPEIGPAGKGQVPRTLSAVYAEAGLPQPTLPTAGERRAKARNLRTVTIARRTPSSRRERMATVAAPPRRVAKNPPAATAASVTAGRCGKHESDNRIRTPLA
ncbi:MAG: transposase, partial [Candidatus Eisenbacteria bacterium]|nr:transposase [Candidatus Eisenbacteria bacterium]